MRQIVVNLRDVPVRFYKYTEYICQMQTENENTGIPVAYFSHLFFQKETHELLFT
jgi:hypothetical protein